MLMYTSCGWFFNDVGGIETIQVLQYAGRAVQLAEELFDARLEAGFIERLERAEGNDPELVHARFIYERRVKPAMVDLMHVAAHYAVSSIFGGFEKHERVYCYTVQLEEHAQRESGDAKLSVGRASIQSDVTAERATMTFALLHFGGHNLSGGIRRFIDEAEYDREGGELLDAFAKGEFATVIQRLASFPEYTFSLRSLFADRQREILYHTLDESLRRAENAYRRLYEENAAVMRYLIDLDLPLPRAFAMAAEFVLNRELRLVFSSDVPDLYRARTLLDEAKETQITLDGSGLGYAVRRTLERLAGAVLVAPYETAPLERLAEIAALARSLPFPVDLWKVQNLFYQAVQKRFPPPALPRHAGAAVAGPPTVHGSALDSALAVMPTADAPAAAAAAQTSGDEAWQTLARLVGEQLDVAVP
jgi:hypothetical protein